MDIIVEKLIKEYDKNRVLDINKLKIEKGSLCGIIGANGAGKSTFLNIVAGLEKQTSGRVFYGNSSNEEIPLDIMTMVFQRPYMLSTTVEKNISYPLKLRGWNAYSIENRVAQLCKELGLTHLMKRKSWKLSGGEVQKVALARALSFKPKLLLLDEPTANIDPKTTGEIELILKKINIDEGITVIIITHNLVQAKRLCHDVVFMNQGQIIEFGRTAEVLKNPKYELTKQFISGELII
ncbi:ABC transporter ATP-binding protein [Anaerovorax odorimutans]|uniref:ABC transporter ATP-binding protein n=1 Tax=Anaerovorax odorimutans TaxID=109327 RepID=UPI00041E59B0|nr:ABC transporter ATP-binding protein [Anaerovorax odorimutans]